MKTKKKAAKRTAPKPAAAKPIPKPTNDAVVMVSVQLPSGETGTYRYTVKNIKGNVIPSQLNTQLFNQVFYNGLRTKFGDSIKVG